MKTIQITSADTVQTVREALRQAGDPLVIIILPWEVEKGWDRPLEYEMLYREALRQNEGVIWIVEDPEFRPFPAESGFPVYASMAEATEALHQMEKFPALRQPPRPVAPVRPWWADTPEPRRGYVKPPTWFLWVELAILGIVLAVLGGVAFLVGPSARVTLTPQGTVYRVVVPVSIDPDAEEVDLQRGVIPSRRIGEEDEAYAETSTTGVGTTVSGKAHGTVIFTNLLGQDYRVPKGTIVRSTATSFPVRFATVQEVTAPSFGQVAVDIEALEEGTAGNISASQINMVEGVAGLALRVTNPASIGGAESAEVPMVSEGDQERVWKIATQQVLGQVRPKLLNELESGEFLPPQDLVVEARPKEAYTHLVGEQSPTLGLTLRLLVSGQAVKISDAQAVAYHALASHLPEEFALTDAHFEYGEAAEEDVGPGYVTFYVTAYGYASAEIDSDAVWNKIKGRSVATAQEMLKTSLPLARPPEITVEPSWFPFIPNLALRTEIKIVPNEMPGD